MSKLTVNMHGIGQSSIKIQRILVWVIVLDINLILFLLISNWPWKLALLRRKIVKKVECQVGQLGLENYFFSEDGEINFKNHQLFL